MSMELRLLHSLVDREVYDGCIDILRPSAFSEDLEGIVEAVQELHEEYPKGVDLDVVMEHIKGRKVSTTSKLELLDDLVSKIKATKPVDTDIARNFIFKLARRDQRLNALNQLARVIENNEDSHEEVISTLSALPEEDEADGEIVSTALSELAEHYDSSKRIPFNIPVLQSRIGGLQKGNLAIVFGRPEVGKSSFIAALASGFIRNGITVEYYANEEPGTKIMLNIRRAVTGEDDAGIVAAIKSKATNPVWEKAAKNLTVRQIGAMSIEKVHARLKKNPKDVLILDQTDKFHQAAKYDAGHERLQALYQKTREIAKGCNCVVINVTQASVDAEGKHKVTYSMMDQSKTGKSAEADLIIGIGKYGEMHPEGEDSTAQVVGVCTSKNKINGYHGTESVFFNAHTNQWSSENGQQAYGNSVS